MTLSKSAGAVAGLLYRLLLIGLLVVGLIPSLGAARQAGATSASAGSQTPPSGRQGQPAPAPPSRPPAGSTPAPAPGRNSAVLLNSGPMQQEFRKRVDAYVELQKKLVSQLPPLPDEATPQQIDQRQRQLAKGIMAVRTPARVGDIFTPSMQAFVRELLARVFSGPDGKEMRSMVMDENPIGLKIEVNGRYPDEVPMSSMPPAVLEALPQLPKEIEYRFIGDRLILLDVQAHLIIDLVPNALPKV
jgi:hypothetical protein